MAHKFDGNNRSKLDNEERKKLLAPDQTLIRLGYKEGDAMADIGCGTGLFTMPAAGLGGEHAKIYAVDVSAEMLSEVKKRAEAGGFGNIITVKSEEYDFGLKDDSVDFALVCAVLHEIDDKHRFLLEAQRICKKDGTIAIIDFTEAQTGFGPPLSHRITRQQVEALLAEAGLRRVVSMDISEAFYAVTARKA